MNALYKKKAIALAKNIVTVEEKISKLILNEKLNFDVYHEDGKGYIVTEMCGMGGCACGVLEFNSYEEALKQAAILTLGGMEIRVNGACFECLLEYNREHV